MTALPIRHRCSMLLLCCVVGCDDGMGVRSPSEEEPIAGNSLTDVSVYERGTCTLYGSGRVRCWRSDNAVIDMLGDVEAVELGGTCALDRDGTAHCWGETGTTITVREGPYRRISAGVGYGCAIRADGWTECWGGAVGATATRVQTDTQFTSVKGNASWACGLTAEGAVHCWALTPGNPTEQLSNPMFRAAFKAVEISKEIKFTSIAMSSSHACGLTLERITYCWGSNQLLALGVTNSGREGCYDATPWPYSTYPSYACATPQRVDTNLRFKSIVTSSAVSCGLLEDGTTHCWGANINKLMDMLPPGGSLCRIGNDVRCTSVPQQHPTSLRFERLMSGYAASHLCGLTAGGGVFCWGAVDHRGAPHAEYGVGTLEPEELSS